MNLIEIAEHTIDVNRLSGGYVLDAGCRDFGFSKGLAARGCSVIAMDADPTIGNPKINNITFLNKALAAEPGNRFLVMHADPQARYLSPVGSNTGDAKRVIVDAVTIQQVMHQTGVAHWDVIKLDIEGSEYNLLLSFPGPVTTQIAIEFHEHVQPRPQELYDEIFTHLGKWYDVVQHKKEPRYGCHANYWDTLLVIKPGRYTCVPKSTMKEAPSRGYDVAKFVGNPARAKELLGWQAKIRVEDGVRNLVNAFKTCAP